MCGSLGTLAIVTSATFKLSPVAPCSQTVVATLTDLRKLSEAVALAVASAPVVGPSAIELQSPPHRLLIRIGTVSRGRCCRVDADGRHLQAARRHDERDYRSGRSRRVAGAREPHLQRSRHGREDRRPRHRRRRRPIALVQQLSMTAGVECAFWDAPRHRPASSWRRHLVARGYRQRHSGRHRHAARQHGRVVCARRSKTRRRPIRIAWRH